MVWSTWGVALVQPHSPVAPQVLLEVSTVRASGPLSVGACDWSAHVCHGWLASVVWMVTAAAGALSASAAKSVAPASNLRIVLRPPRS